MTKSDPFEGTQIGEDGRRAPIDGTEPAQVVGTVDPKAETEGLKETEKVNEENEKKDASNE